MHFGRHGSRSLRDGSCVAHFGHPRHCPQRGGANGAISVVQELQGTLDCDWIAVDGHLEICVETPCGQCGSGITLQSCVTLYPALLCTASCRRSPQGSTTSQLAARRSASTADVRISGSGSSRHGTRHATTAGSPLLVVRDSVSRAAHRVVAHLLPRRSVR